MQFKYNIKERNIEINYSCFGARNYDSELSNWLSVDPMADERSWVSPYSYVQNSPVNRVDPSGALDDWVKNEKTREYVWKDNVTSAQNTPEGFSYVGPKDNDILNDLGLPTEPLYKEQSSMGFGFDGDNRSGAPIGTKTNASGSVNISPVISYDLQSENENNKLGRKFEGIDIDISLVTGSKSTKNDFRNNYLGYSNVNIANTNYSKTLEKPKGFFHITKGSSLLKSSYFFNSNYIQNNNINSIYISAGATNNNLLMSPKPIKFKWNF